MKTKEELVNTYIKYSSDITEEIWDKLVIKFKELGFYLWQNKGYKRYKEGSIIFINEKGDNSYWVTDGYFTPNADKKEIQVSDILGEESQFEVGKYYFYNWDWRDSGKFICKIEKVSDNYIHCEWEYDIENKEFDDASGIATRLDEISEVKELTQEEIQQYLPDNHPDKIVKPIEKWSVGSYVVFIRSYGDSNKGEIDKIKKILDSDRIWGEKEGVTTKDSRYTRWFATLPEAEAFSKSLLEPEESKTLTINDLVEGEIYYWEAKDSDHDWWIRKCSNSGTNRSNLKISRDYFDAIHGTLDSNSYIISKATSEQIKHLKVCEKQNKFIPQDQLDMYDSEGNLIEDKPKFKIGDYVITNKYSSLYNGRILRITKFSDRYPDIAYFEVFDDGYYSKNDNFSLDKVERFATSEEIAKVTKPKTKPFEFNKWYKSNNADGLFFIQSKNTGYGFRSNHVNYWFTNNKDFEWNTDGLELAENSLVKERLISYAKEKYPVGTKYIGIVNHNEEKVSRIPTQLYHNFNDNFLSIEIGIDYIFYKDKWADIISTPVEESKEFDRNWYVEVSSQEEADKVFEYLESIGERITPNENYNRKYIPDIGNGYKYIFYVTTEWFLGENPGNKPQKQLSDIIPDYSKVDRNVYYEVSNQEEYEEILDWLESNGEKVDRGFCVNSIWNFVYYYKDSKDWYLGCVKPDLPKAKFPFKSKQSSKVNNYFEEACPFPSFGDFSVDLLDVTTSIISEQVICPTIEETPTKEKVKVQLINVPRI